MPSYSWPWLLTVKGYRKQSAKEIGVEDRAGESPGSECPDVSPGRGDARIVLHSRGARCDRWYKALPIRGAHVSRAAGDFIRVGPVGMGCPCP